VYARDRLACSRARRAGHSPADPCHEASSRKVAPGEAILLYVLTFVAALIGGFTFGLVGIGLPLVLVPALSILFGDVRTAVVVASIPSLFSAIYIAWRGGFAREDLQVFWPVFPLSIVGVFIGNEVLVSINPASLMLFIGGMLLLFVGLTLLPIRVGLTPTAGRRLAPIVGLAVGMVHGAVGISGPLLAIFYHGFHLPKRRFVGMMVINFVVMGVMQVLAQAGSKLYTVDILVLSIGLVLPTIIGIQIGTHVQNLVQERTFNYVLLAVLFLTGLSLIIQTVGAIP